MRVTGRLMPLTDLDVCYRATVLADLVGQTAGASRVVRAWIEDGWVLVVMDVPNDWLPEWQPATDVSLPDP